MTITQVGSITGPVTVSNANLTVTEPAGCQENDYLIVWIAHKSAIGYQALNGWTKLQDQSIGDIDSTDGIGSGELFYIKRGASAPNLLFTKETGTGDVAMGRCVAYRGIHTTDPIRASTSTTAAIGATVATASALSALVGDLCFMGLAGGDSYSFSAEQINGAPTALTELADSSTTTGADTANAVAIKVLTADISSKTLQATASGALGRNVIAAAYFKPAPNAYTLACDYGSYELVGQAMIPKAARSLIMGYGSFALAGQIVLFKHDYKILVGYDAYALTGQALTLKAAFNMAVGYGSYVLNGQEVLFKRGYTILVGYGLYDLIGQDIALKTNHSMAMGYGIYILSGQDVELKSAFNLSMNYGTYELTGYDIEFVFVPASGGIDYVLAMDAGYYDLAGQDVALKRGYILPMDYGSYVITGYDIDFISTGGVAYTMDMDAGYYTMTGGNLVFWLNIIKTLAFNVKIVRNCNYNGLISRVVNGNVALTRTVERKVTR